MTINTEIKYNILPLDISTNNTKSIYLQISESNSIYIIHRALTQQLNTQRQGNANSKTRSEVRGGGKKPWKQKGTGKARAGSIRSPLWKGGGVIFGPKSKKYIKKINKKEKQLALRNILYNRKNLTTIVNNSQFQLEKISTKLVIEKISQLNLNLNNKIVIIVEKKDNHLYLSTRNLYNVELIAANQINILSIIKAKHIIITEKSLDIIQNIYNG